MSKYELQNLKTANRTDMSYITYALKVKYFKNHLFQLVEEIIEKLVPFINLTSPTLLSQL